MSNSGKRSLMSPAKRQANISSFFSPTQDSPSRQVNPASETIDLTIDSDEDHAARPAKRARTTSEFFQPRTTAKSNQLASAAAPQSQYSGVADQWRFDPSSSSQSTQNTRGTGKDSALRRRHDRARRILLGNSEFFTSTREPANDDPDSSSSDNGEDSGAEEVEPPGEKFSELMNFFASGSPSKKLKGASNRGKRIAQVGPSGQTYTEFELQVIEFKDKYKDAILMFQDGYKMRFFGEDAKIAFKELGIACFPKRNFYSAMIPLHRKDVYLKKLLSKGHKVGVVEQTETAALKKASNNRSKIFTRELTQLHTAATFVDDLNSVEQLEQGSAPSVMCLVEQLRGGMGPDERVYFGVIVITPSTGDVVWDDFEDNHMRSELETRLTHAKPYEVLCPRDNSISKPTQKLINHFIQDSNVDHVVRKEAFREELSYTEAFAFLTKFYTNNITTMSQSPTASQSFNSGELMAKVSEFPNLVAIALAHAIKYLAGHDVDCVLRETKFFAKFTERTHMLLNSNTLTNLDVYRNETDFTTRGSLIWILDHTSTRFGARMLKNWIGRPLTDLKSLYDRINAVEEILEDKTPKLTVLRQLLKRLPDLSRGLCRIQYGKCTPQELAVLLPAFDRIATAFSSAETSGRTMFESGLLNDVVTAFPKLKEPIKDLLGTISLKSAKDGRKDILWTDPDKYPEIDTLTASIQVVESELMDELKKIRKAIKKPALQYATVAGEEYLVEINRTERRDIPHSWARVSSTQNVERFRPPEVRAKLDERARYKEALEAAANKAYLAFLDEIVQNYYALLRDAVNKLAIADCLFSLAIVALQQGYVKPEFTMDDTLDLVDGRHPMVEAIRSDPFVPNSVHMGGGQPRSKIITGPNMGGKSSVVRMVAVCAIMAQIGSYVPASAMKIGMLDGILTRMGASDDIARGRSTFMVEMQETSDILKLATSRTLVILDELGRGTATFDGMAIAGAALEHLVQNTRCKTMFITHFPQVAADIERRYPLEIENLHMGYTEETRVDGKREVTFLYRLTKGITTESFGVECARLAGLPEPLLTVATSESANMRALIEGRVRRTKLRKALQRIQDICTKLPTEAHAALEELRSLAASAIPGT